MTQKSTQPEMKIHLNLKVEYEANHDGYDIWSRDVPGVYSWGKTRESADKAYIESLHEYLDVLIQLDKPIPEFILKQIQKQVNVLFLLREAITATNREFSDSTEVAIAA